MEKKKNSHEEEAFESSLQYFKEDELISRVWINKDAVKKSFGNILKKLPKDNHYCIINLIEYNESEYSTTLNNIEQKTFVKNRINKSKLMSFMSLGWSFAWICNVFKNNLIDYSPFMGLFINIVCWLLIILIIISILSYITAAINKLLVEIKVFRKNLSRNRNIKIRIFQTRT